MQIYGCFQTVFHHKKCKMDIIMLRQYCGFIFWSDTPPLIPVSPLYNMKSGFPKDFLIRLHSDQISSAVIQLNWQQILEQLFFILLEPTLRQPALKSKFMRDVLDLVEVWAYNS